MSELTDEQKQAIDEIVNEAMNKAGLLEAERKMVFDDDMTNDRDLPKPFKSFGEQLQAVAKASSPTAIDPRLHEVAKATGLGEVVPSDGGFLVQYDFAAELIKRTYEVGEILKLCRKTPIGAGKNGLKVNAIDETSRANGSRWGGIRGYWLNEGGTKTASKPAFRQMELLLKKLIGLCYATDELLEDAVALESIIREGFAEEIAFKVEDAIINGDGAGKPLGIINGPCLVSVAKETGQAATTIVTENVIKMWARMWGKSRSNAVWLINQDIEPQLYTMSLAVGTGGVPVYMPANGISGKPYGMLMGRPVMPCEYCATLGTQGDIILADFSQYALIDKGAPEAATSIHVQFTTDETAFRFVYRTDGQPTWNSALTPFKGSNTLSPFVVLDTRS